MNKSIIFPLLLLLMVAGCSKNNVTDSNEKPDLTIDSVSYKVLPSCYEGNPSGVICVGPNAVFTLTIRNIGTTDLRKSFYISASRSEQDFQNNYCSSTMMVNGDSIAIPVNGTLDVPIQLVFPDTVSKILFVINTDDRFDRGVPLPVIPEMNYDNNSYVLDMKW